MNSKIKVQLVDEDGNIEQEHEFDGLIAVGFKDVQLDLLQSILKNEGNMSMVLGSLSPEDFVIASKLIESISRESLDDIGYDFDIIESEILGGE